MKKLLSLLIVILFVLTSQAKVWRVNNIEAMNADYTSFVAAQANVSSNDTLYFEGSTVSYGDITLTKPLVIIGTGYFLKENPQTQSSPLTATFGKVNFNSGSSGSELIGAVVTSKITISVSDIIVTRCLINSGSINLNSRDSSIGNILILKNYITTTLGTTILCSDTYPIYNLLISNNYIKSGNYDMCLSFGKNTSAEIKNNTMRGNVSVSNSRISNNILIGGNINNSENNYYYNNICNGTQFPAGNGNQHSVNMTGVFVGSTGNSTDGQWQLKKYSPALNAGSDGSDCGMFGGSSPYVLSGLPSIPSIYEIIVPTTGDNINGMNVTIKAKNH